MFKPLPNRKYGSILYSSDVVKPEHVYAAIIEAKTKCDEALRCYDEFAENSSEDDGWADHAFRNEQEVAELERIRAVLLSAIYIEGAINAWGVYVAGEIFFKAHIERCTFESKIALIIALCGKDCIPKNHPAILAIRDLFERRNQIAHRKTKDRQNDDINRDFYHIRDVKASTDLDACKTALDAFQKLLSEIDTRVASLAGFYGNDNEKQ